MLRGYTDPQTGESNNFSTPRLLTRFPNPLLLCTLLQDILHPSHHLLNVLLQIASKLGLRAKKKKLMKKSAATALNIVLASVHIQMPQ
jgi:hypothetical protein